jgi:CO/xanthine dehydrogenase Mo-binding subunit
VTRREWLAGTLVVRFAMQAQTGRTANAHVDSWIAIAADGTVTAFAGKCDFGQGFRTVQHQLVAEELDVPLARVRMTICDTALCPDQGVSSGSQGHPAQFGRAGLRQALATAREALLEMAARRLGAPVAELTVVDGVVRHRNGSVSYAELVGGRRWEIPVNPRAVPKRPAEYRVLGKSVPRLDVAPKVTGEFEYVHHVRVPGMAHARVVRPPEVGAKLVRVDRRTAGKARVVVRKDLVAVVAETEWQAIRAAGALRVEWTKPAAAPEQRTLYEAMRKMPGRGAIAVDSGDVDGAMAGAAQRISATYLHPFQLHGSMGTSCAVADVREGKATIWSASQGVFNQRDSLSLVLGIPKERIRSIFVEGSGCYGLNGADAVAYDAAVISQEIGRPVRLQYSRRDEMAAGECFGPAYVIDLRAAIGADGQIAAWDHEAWTFSKGSRPSPGSPGNIISGELLGYTAPAVTPTATPSRAARFSNNSNVVSSYGTGCVGGACGGTGRIATERAVVHTIPSPFYTGPLRSPARLQNTFAHESFIDEIAAALKADPVDYRMRHLADPRLRDVLQAAAKAAGWQRRPSPNRANPRTGTVSGRGAAIVLYEGNNGYGALVAEVAVDQTNGRVTVTKMFAANDSGPVSNPDGLRAQMEGGALQGMTRALFEEVRWTGSRIESVDWASYPVYEFGGPIPKVECVLIDRPDKPHMGAGETIITLSAAAIANAIFDATGARVRQAPFTPDRVLAALRARG